MDFILYAVNIMPQLFSGIIITACFSIFSLFFGMFISLNLCYFERNIKPFLRVYISFFRGAPILLILMIFFYIPSYYNININQNIVGLLVLSFNSSVFQYEFYNASLKNISFGQILAARSLGMKESDIFKTVLTPQILKKSISQIFNEFSIVLKNTSLLSVIFITDLSKIGQQIASSTYKYLETYIIILFIYYILSKIAFYIEKSIFRRKNQCQEFY